MQSLKYCKILFNFPSSALAVMETLKRNPKSKLMFIIFFDVYIAAKTILKNKILQVGNVKSQILPSTVRQAHCTALGRPPPERSRRVGTSIIKLLNKEIFHLPNFVRNFVNRKVFIFRIKDILTMSS
jgi:hypothetical protein